MRRSLLEGERSPQHLVICGPQIMAAKEMARRLEGTGMDVFVVQVGGSQLHVGWVRCAAHEPCC